MSGLSRWCAGAAGALLLIASPAYAAQPAPDDAQPPAAYLKLIAEMRTTGRPRAALAHLDAFETKHPRDPQARLLRGDCLVDVGQYEAAEAVYRPLLKGPQGAAASAGLGRTAALRGDWTAAAANFAEAVRRAPIAASYVGDLGFALLRSGDTSGAVFRLRQAAELAPDSPTIRNNLILALEASGDGEAAKRLLAQVTDLKERRDIDAMRTELAAPAASPRG